MRPVHHRAIFSFLALFGILSLLRADTIEGVPVTVLARTLVAEGGRIITYTRIRPPALPPKPVPPAAPVTEPTAAELAENSRLQTMNYVSFNPSVTVHLRPPIVSEFRWRNEDREWVVWANIDARLLASIWQWQSATTVYDWFPMISEIGGEDDVRPTNLGLNPGPAEYVVEATAAALAANEVQFAALDTMLAYHDLHRVELAADLVRRESQSAEAERIAALPKPKPTDETIYFWKIETPVATTAPAP